MAPCRRLRARHPEEVAAPADRPPRHRPRTSRIGIWSLLTRSLGRRPRPTTPLERSSSTASSATSRACSSRSRIERVMARSTRPVGGRDDLSGVRLGACLGEATATPAGSCRAASGSPGPPAPRSHQAFGDQPALPRAGRARRRGHEDPCRGNRAVAVSGTNRKECLNRGGIRAYPRLSAASGASHPLLEAPANPQLLAPNSPGASLDRTQEVAGSSPASSTSETRCTAAAFGLGGSAGITHDRR